MNRRMLLTAFCGRKVITETLADYVRDQRVIQNIYRTRH
ncbi:CRISPR/Cas system-associated endonuclease Cas3-HD [Rhizobium sp. BK609]|nr:CRISPR/Cas system-associated endonuclease Cas3-HD [Rhizobium sp. BK098]MBB3613506.1 CRISPR/Cas system-associated endonuclease Cas3-HD [Rhizobium sp. BK609]MBB3679164.1 CRISPR/Cas system-associated endonuclease Cas3-HD [Rhizobium sp. BK612]